MKKLTTNRGVSAAVLALLCAGATAEEAQDPTDGGPNAPEGFAWLERFKGDWATALNGTMRCRVVGKKWVVNEISFQGSVYSIQTLGYDDQKRAYVGSWVDASSSFLWRYTGSLDPTGRVLVLEAEGPDMNDPTKMTPYRDTYEFQSKDEITAQSQQLGADGEWKILSTSTMTRQPK